MIFHYQIPWHENTGRSIDIGCISHLSPKQTQQTTLPRHECALGKGTRQQRPANTPQHPLYAVGCRVGRLEMYIIHFLYHLEQSIAEQKDFKNRFCRLFVVLSPQIILFHPLHIFTLHTVALHFARSGLKENAEDTVIVHDVLGKALFTFMYVSLLMPAMPERRRMLIRLPSTRQVWRRISR